VGQLYRNGMFGGQSGPRTPFCINFLNVFDFVTCYEPEEQQYIFMQQIDTTMHHINMSRWSEAAKTFAFMQLLLSIYVYQSLNISHNDLKTDNIFMEKITEDTTYNGQHILKANYLEYKLPGGASFYLTIPEDNAYIVKIGDWGQSVKYGMAKLPTVGNFGVFLGEFDGYQMGIKDPVNTPNWFAPAYDLFTFLNTAYQNYEDILFPGATGPWLRWMIGDAPFAFDYYNRPLNKNVDKYKNVSDVLDSDLFKNFKVRPAGRVLKVCDINRLKTMLLKIQH
jgi:serine/threonine protein kinase